MLGKLLLHMDMEDMVDMVDMEERCALCREGVKLVVAGSPFL